MAAAIVVVVLLLLALLPALFGTDTRDGRDWQPRGDWSANRNAPRP